MTSASGSRRGAVREERLRCASGSRGWVPLDASEFRRLGRDQAVVFMPGLPPLVVKKRPYFADPALQRLTEEEPWHEPPAEEMRKEPASLSPGSASGFDAEDSSRERGFKRSREGEAKERSHGGL
jgi:type IV secretory pathway TraG/TraD family ATPase VirD4